MSLFILAFWTFPYGTRDFRAPERVTSARLAQAVGVAVPSSGTAAQPLPHPAPEARLPPPGSLPPPGPSLPCAPDLTDCRRFSQQDLLQLQYEGVAVMKLFDRAKVNVNLLIFLLNKKFYGK